MKKAGMNKTFGEFFRPFINFEGLPETIAQGVIETMQVDSINRCVAAAVQFPSLVEREALYEAEKRVALSPGLQLTRASLCPKFPPEAFCAEYLPSLVLEMKRRDASINGTFSDAQARLEEGKIIVTLAHGGAELMRQRRADRLMSRIISEEFGLTVAVDFDGVTEVDVDSSAYLERQRQTEERLRREAVVEAVSQYESTMNRQSPHEKKVAARQAANQTPRVGTGGSAETWGERVPPVVNIRSGATMLPAILPETMKEIHGRMGRVRLMQIAKITPDAGSVAVWGEIFSMETRMTRDQSRKIYSINITDYTGSITLKILQDAKQCRALDELSNGTSIVVRGEVEYDKYDHEIVLRPRAVATVEQAKVVDDAPVKRVELHLHTNMSSMDGVTGVGELIARAAKWGHPAIAITDHGVAQAYPDAMNAAAKVNSKGGHIKVIYGVESYFINDMVPAVKGDSDAPFSGEFISFDIETTGLSPNQERITEIGAVRLRNGEIVETFDTFVNPEKPIPPKITELTGITNEMVKDAPSEREALEAFFRFCGSDAAILVAHNAEFDTSFLRAAARRCEMEFPYTYIDTLPMCRSLLKDLKNHKLDTVANYLKLAPFNHHRANDDAAVLGGIFAALLQRLHEDTGAETVQQINTSLTDRKSVV